MLPFLRDREAERARDCREANFSALSGLAQQDASWKVAKQVATAVDWLELGGRRRLYTRILGCKIFDTKAKRTRSWANQRRKPVR